MKFENIRALLAAVGPRLERLTVECDEEQVTRQQRQRFYSCLLAAPRCSMQQLFLSF